MASAIGKWTGIAAVLVALIGPVWFGYRSTLAMRNFRVVRANVLYRSGQMTIAGLRQAKHDFDIKTVISLRDVHRPGEAAPDAKEEEFCNKEEIVFHRIVLGRWYAEDGPPEVDEGIRRFREIMADPANYPVLVHCLAGVHRTGAACAIYRMEQEHWSNERAMSEMKDSGYATLDDEWDILGYLEIYRPTWKEPLEQPPVRRRPPSKPGVKQTRHSSRAE